MSLSLPAGVQRAGRGSLESIVVEHAGALGEVTPHGATVIAWLPDLRGPVLWVSPSSPYQADKSIRGGIPICFPWFGPNTRSPTAPQHGFVRTGAWSLEDVRESPHGDAVVVSFSRRDDDATRALWPHAFVARLTASFGAKLEVVLAVENPGELPLTFEAALHTYFAVSDVRAVSVRGLEDTVYIDKVDNHARKRSGHEPLVLTGETDRVFLGTTSACEIVDPAWKRRISIQKDGSRTTVVWNPWEAKASAMKDVGDGWTGMLCVETANAFDDAVTLAPGAEHVMRLLVVVNDMPSYG